MVAPEPVHVSVALPPAQVVQRAAQRLVGDGFAIATSDAAGGVLTAVLTQHGAGSWGPFLACRFADDAIAHTRGSATLSVRLTAQSEGSGSRVVIASSVAHAVDAGMLSQRDETGCASTGEAEHRVIAALNAQ